MAKSKSSKQDSGQGGNKPSPHDETEPVPPPEPGAVARAVKAELKTAKKRKDKKGKKGKKLSKKERRAAAVHAVATRLKAARPKVEKLAHTEPTDQLTLAVPDPGQPTSRSPQQQPGPDGPPAAGLADPDVIARELIVGPDFDLAGVDTSATPGFEGDKAVAGVAMAAAAEELTDLQERLYAHGQDGGSRSLLLLVQGMDTSGKGGIMRHVIGSMDPQGIELTAFKAPTGEEKAKGYLWRIRQALPGPGYVGVFDRSHYEDVLPVRVLNLAPRSVWGRRYNGINTFESQMVNRGMTIVKVMLHISKDEQGERLSERIDRPDKHWKYDPGDIDDRELWEDYMAAYQEVLDRCSTPNAPWYVVPADKKWYARLAVQQLVLRALREMDLGWPEAHFDIETERRRLAES